jgi:hypothetical protein
VLQNGEEEEKQEVIFFQECLTSQEFIYFWVHGAERVGVKIVTCHIGSLSSIILLLSLLQWEENRLIIMILLK